MSYRKSVSRKSQFRCLNHSQSMKVESAMSRERLPSLSVLVGDKSDFAVDIVLPAIERPMACAGPTAVLQMSDGFLTMYVQSVNVFELEAATDAQCLLSTHTSLSLSMVLEWVYFDKAYDIATGEVKSFAEIVGGESTPELKFQRRDRDLLVFWNFERSTRLGRHYRTRRGELIISYSQFVISLATFVGALEGALNSRSTHLGFRAEWQQWLEGYRDEKEAFTKYVGQFDGE